jgi:hypothetical protein
MAWKLSADTRRVGDPATRCTASRIPPCPSAWSGSGDQGKQPAGDRGGWCRAVQGDRARLVHLRLECSPALAGLLPARLAASGRMRSVVPGEPCLLRLRVDAEQEHPVEQPEQLVLVPGDAAGEYGLAASGQDLLEPGVAPHPAMRPEPVLVRARRAAATRTADISSPYLGVFAVAAARVLLCAFFCVVDTLPEQDLRRRPDANPLSLAILELSGYCVNVVHLHVNAADALVRPGVDRNGFR